MGINADTRRAAERAAVVPLGNARRPATAGRLPIFLRIGSATEMQIGWLDLLVGDDLDGDDTPRMTISRTVLAEQLRAAADQLDAGHGPVDGVLSSSGTTVQPS